MPQAETLFLLPDSISIYRELLALPYRNNRFSSIYSSVFASINNSNITDDAHTPCYTGRGVGTNFFSLTDCGKQAQLKLQLKKRLKS